MKVSVYNRTTALIKVNNKYATGKETEIRLRPGSSGYQ